jgi:hypothetical protein
MREFLRRPRAILLGVLATLLVAGPLAYGTHNVAGGLITAAMFWAWGVFLTRSVAWATVYVLVVSATEAALVATPLGPLANAATPAVTRGFIGGLAGSLLGGIAWGFAVNRTGRRGAIVGATALLGLAFGTDARSVETVAVGAGALVGGLPGASVGRRLKPAVVALFDIWLYLREMTVPAIAFMLGYVGIVVVFAGWYAAVYTVNPTGSFKSEPEHGPLAFGDFVYFSIVTFSTVGFGDISPISTVARLLVAFEIFLGTLWVVIVFAAITAYLAPHFARLARQPRGIWGRLVGLDGPAASSRRAARRGRSETRPSSELPD